MAKQTISFVYIDRAMANCRSIVPHMIYVQESSLLLAMITPTQYNLNSRYVIGQTLFLKPIHSAEARIAWFNARFKRFTYSINHKPTHE